MVTKYKIVIKRTREREIAKGVERRKRDGLVNAILIN